MVVLVYGLSIQEGLKTYKKVAYKIYPNGKVYKQESLFRYGLHLLQKKANSLLTWIQYLINQIEITKHKYQSPKTINVQ